MEFSPENVAVSTSARLIGRAAVDKGKHALAERTSALSLHLLTAGLVGAI